MAEMTATFEATLDVWKLLEGKPTEYVVVNPLTVEVELKDGEVMRYPQGIRERVVRCRDCVFFGKTAGGYCELLEFSMAPGMEEGFCAWGVGRDG